MFGYSLSVNSQYRFEATKSCDLMAEERAYEIFMSFGYDLKIEIMGSTKDSFTFMQTTEGPSANCKKNTCIDFKEIYFRLENNQCVISGLRDIEKIAY